LQTLAFNVLNFLQKILFLPYIFLRYTAFTAGFALHSEKSPIQLVPLLINQAKLHLYTKKACIYVVFVRPASHLFEENSAYSARHHLMPAASPLPLESGRKKHRTLRFRKARRCVNGVKM